MAVAFTIIRIRIYVFWAQWWRQTIVETKICSIATTFNISTSTVDCGTGGSSATTIGAEASSTMSSGSTGQILMPIHYWQNDLFLRKMFLDT